VIAGLKVCQVRVIFSLPENYSSFPHPMAYVEWFTPLRNPVPELGMYQISRSTHSQRRRASIIPVSQSSDPEIWQGNQSNVEHR
jgi:hypothetical protein